MKLNVNGVGAYYVQMLLMLYFPGERFPENSDGELISCDVCVSFDEGRAAAAVVLSGLGRTERGESVQCPVAGLDMTEDRMRKLAVGRAVWKAASAFTGHSSPWGILTGVRPAKLAEQIAAAGADPERVLTEVYGLTPEKAALCARVAKNGASLVTEESRRECSLYIAIPFCPTRCAYCSFVSYTSPRLLSLIPEYLDMLADDIDFTFRQIDQLGMNIATVYIGGGTPTTLDAGQLDRLLSIVSKGVSRHKVREFTVEAGRPDTITAEKCDVLRSRGVGRVSVNTQTLNDGILKSIGRSHTAADFFRAYEIARVAGFNVINVDLIAALPGESAESAVDSARRIAELRPENITVHTFSVKKSAELRRPDSYDSVGAEGTRALAGMHREVFSAGYEPYYMYRQKNTVGNLENVGFALPGDECLYNIYMMDEIHSIFAVGASSVTKFTKGAGDERRIKRIFEAKYPYEYLRDHTGEAGVLRKKRLEEQIGDFFGK